MKKLLLLFLLLFSVFIFAETAQAKLLPQAQKNVQKSKATGKVSTGTKIGVSARLRADRRALIVNYSNLQNATQVSYLLTYKTSVQEEGAMGTLSLSGSANSTSELLFGTCSKNVCRYHTGIRDARFEVSYTSKTGKKYIKRFKVKA